jgi:stage V sporulation protein AC
MQLTHGLHVDFGVCADHSGATLRDNACEAFSGSLSIRGTGVFALAKLRSSYKSTRPGTICPVSIGFPFCKQFIPFWNIRRNGGSLEIFNTYHLAIFGGCGAKLLVRQILLQGSQDMKTTKESYDKIRKESTPASPHGKNLVGSFLIGGGICALGEGLSRLYTHLGASEKTAGILVPVTLVVLTAVLTATGVFDRIAKHGAAGTGVPISGFANAIVAPAMEHQSEGRVLGVGANLFRLSGPVLAYGTALCSLYGVIYYLFLRK